jgi:DNA primase
LIYFNSRYIGGSKTALRYKGPEKEVGVGKGDVLYFPEWPRKESRVFLAEGEFDGKSICVAGLPGGAFGGKALTETQIQILRDNKYLPTICLDNDKAGRASLPKMGDDLLRAGFSKVGFVRPPVQHKDWNVFLEKHGPRMLRAYILSRTKEYSEWTSMSLKMQQI